jgi:hypothetical protein
MNFIAAQAGLTAINPKNNHKNEYAEQGQI